MSKLEELIQQYCPDGVEYHKVKEVYTRLKGTPITAGKMKEINNPGGAIRVFAGGKTVIDANEEDIPNANITRVPAVLVQSRGVIDAVYYDKPFTFKNEMWAYTAKDIPSVKYLYYVLKSNMQTFRDAASGMGSLPQISLGVTEEFEIPVPPLPVQEEIVRILDNFTELQAELQAELQKRKLQYNYYLDNLLNFNRGGYQAEVKWMKMSEVAQVCRGTRVVKSQLSNKGYPVYQNCLTPMGYYDKANCKGGTTFVICGGAAGNVGYSIVDYWAADDCEYIVSGSEVCNKYLYYYLMTKQDYLSSQVRKASVPRLSPIVIKDLEIPIPSLDEQQRIVSILDRFDALTTDLSQGLPAEIDKRRQQYEYYRDKLLTFKRKAA